MSDVASLEPSKELYELSGWTGSDQQYTTMYFNSANGWVVDTEVPVTALKAEPGDWLPAYDAGYLLRKLPLSVDGGKWKFTMYKAHHNGKGTDWYTVAYVHINWQITDMFNDKVPEQNHYLCEAETPEDALCLLATELWKAGILHD